MFSLKTTYDNSEKTWSGLEKEEKIYPGSSVGEAVFKALKKNPKSICQISDTDGVSLTNEEMLTASIRIAQNLNTEEDDIIGIMTATSTYQAPVVFAGWLSGSIMYPINPFFDHNTTSHVVGITRPKVMFCDADNYEILVGVCKELNLKPRIFTINGRLEGVGNVLDLMESTGSEDTFCPKKCRKDEDDTAVVICSSGTTGLPKGVCISHSYLIEMTPLLSDTVIFTFSGIDWLTGLSFLLHGALSNGTRICTMEMYSPESLRQLIEKYKINLLMVAATQLSSFVKSGEAQGCDTSSVLMFAVGGANVSHSLYVKMQDCMDTGIVTNVYGCTEFGGVSVNLSIHKPKSVGQLVSGVKVRIVDDGGAKLGVGETGEILLWHGEHWAGYYGNPSKTQTILDKEGWYHTGDVGFFDEDGDLHIVDRKKEIMKYRGFHYSAQEIENCIMMLDDVTEVCVFGTMDDEYGDLASAAVIKSPGSKLTESEIVDHVAREMYEKKWLRGGVFFVKDIPKTGSGKYIRTKTRDMCLRIQRPLSIGPKSRL